MGIDEPAPAAPIRTIRQDARPLGHQALGRTGCRRPKPEAGFGAYAWCALGCASTDEEVAGNEAGDRAVGGGNPGNRGRAPRSHRASCPTFFTKFKLERNSSSSEFKGKIDSSKSKCVKGRKVKLIRKHNGNKKTLGDDKTNSKGKFNIKLSTGNPKNGKYYAKAKKKKFDSDQKICLSETSGSVKIS